MTPALRVRLLGGFQFLYNGSLLTTINSIRLRDLIACLILRRHLPQSRSELAYQFWPDSSEEQARANLRNLLHSLRQTIPEIETYLDCDGQYLQWKDEAVSLDLADFEAAIGRAAQADAANRPQEACICLEEAVGYYQGDLLPNCYDDWILPERERLSQMFMNALERLAILWEQQRNYPKAIQYAQALLNYDSLRESTYRTLIRLYALDRDRAGVIRTYRACAQVLRRELSVDPSTVTRQTYEYVIRTGLAYPALADAPSDQPRLMGRTAQWATLLQAWHEAASGQARAVVITGEVGMGKTRLAQELLQWAGRQGIATAYASCRAPEIGLDYAPIIAWLNSRPLPLLDKGTLSEVARLLPQVLRQWPGTPAPAPLAEGWQRHQFYEALVQALQVNRHPQLLVLDDMHWCDAATLAWLQSLMLARSASSLLVVGTLDPAELLDKRPVLRFLETLQREELLTSLALPLLSQVQAAVMLQELLGSRVSPVLAKHLYRRSEGNPLFLVELARASQEAAPMRQATVGLPPRLQNLLAARLQRLSKTARLLAGLAAVGEAPFKLETLEQACDLREGIFLFALDELCQRRILRETSHGFFSFTYDLLRQAVLGALDSTQRQVYQQRIALFQPLSWQGMPPEQMAFDL